MKLVCHMNVIHAKLNDREIILVSILPQSVRENEVM